MGWLAQNDTAAKNAPINAATARQGAQGYLGYGVNSTVPTFKDVPSLNKALWTGKIDQNQWTQQFQKLQPTISGITKAPAAKYSPGNIADAFVGANLTPIKNTLAGAIDKAKSQVQYLSGPTSTQQQRTSIINNQTSAANNPEYIKATQNIKLGTNSAHGLIQAQQMAASGVKAPQIKTFLQNDAKALGQQTQQGVNTALTLSGFSAPGEGILAKTVGPKLSAALGRDEATNTLINTQRVSQATKAATIADKLGGKSVKEATAARIPVVTPTETKAARTSLGSTALANADRTSIPVKSVSTQTVGKVTTPPEDYIKQSNTLSKKYETESAALQGRGSPYAQHVLQDAIDRKYGALQKNLDTKYGQTSVSFAGKSTKVPGSVQLPKSALDTAPRYQSSTNAVGTPSTPVKQIPVSTTKTTVAESKALQTTGEPKVAGSAARTQQKAVEAGMQGEVKGGTTVNTVSHKAEAAKAVELVNSNPQKAMDIAMGRIAGDNASHESAVYHAVTQQALTEAKRTGDFSRVMELANSPRHTGVSEAAQKLGAEGYNLDTHDPIKIMADVAQTREKAVLGKSGTSVTKEARTVGKEVKQAMPSVSRQDWHSFVESLKC